MLLGFESLILPKRVEGKEHQCLAGLGKGDRNLGRSFCRKKERLQQAVGVSRRQLKGRNHPGLVKIGNLPSFSCASEAEEGEVM